MKKTLGMLVAACMILVLAVPAVGAAEYPHNAQFISYYDPAALGNASEQLTGTPGTLYVNPNAQATKSSKALQAILTTTLGGEDWPQFHFDAAHVGLSPSDGLTANNTTVWSKDIKALSSVNPIIANGYVYVLTNYTGMWEPANLQNINLTCLYESNGTVKWHFELPREVHYGSWSSPATDGDYVYVSSDFQLFAINAVTGDEAWNYTTSDVNVNGGPSVGGGNVYFSDWGDGGVGGDYYSINTTTRGVNWIFNNSDTVRYDMAYAQGSPAYDSEDSSVYVTGWTYSGANGTGSRGYIYKVDASGNEVWSNQSIRGENFCGSATFDSDTVYVTSYNFGGNGSLYAYNKSNGVMRWRQTIERTDATPAIANGMVYVSGGCVGYGDPGVRAFYTNGTLAWSNVSAGIGGWTNSVSVADGYAFSGREYSDFGSYNQVSAFNATTGIVEWFYPQGGATAGIANDRVYTIGDNGYLYRF